ncbi:MAG: signal peptidase I [Chlorobium sp.]|nr:MAG: signal peptidase I [Chlorobium sp.]
MNFQYLYMANSGNIWTLQQKRLVQMQQWYDYHGTSMLPLFRVPDRLLVETNASQHLKEGDVIVFLNNSGTHVVHRIVGLVSEGYITQGDNSSYPDDISVTPEMVIGKVVSACRVKRKRKVYGGIRGMVLHRTMHIRKNFWIWLSRFFGWPYRLLSANGLIHSLLPERLKPRVYSFNKGGGVEYQIHFGSRIIGRLRPGMDEWQIIRPYKLFIDPEII